MLKNDERIETLHFLLNNLEIDHIIIYHIIILLLYLITNRNMMRKTCITSATMIKRTRKLNNLIIYTIIQ